MQSMQIINYLAYKNVLDMSSNQCAHQYINYCKSDNFIAVHAQYGGLYEWLANPGDIIKDHKVIGQCTQTHTMTVKDIVLPYDIKLLSIASFGALQKHSHILNVIKLDIN